MASKKHISKILSYLQVVISVDQNDAIKFRKPISVLLKNQEYLEIDSVDKKMSTVTPKYFLYVIDKNSIYKK